MNNDTERRTLYPAFEANHTGYLKVSGGHELYYEESGNPHGKPAVFLHGGPGGGCTEKMRRFFNPDVYRVVLFDQRGCGKSRPHASLEENTTWDLVNDVEILRAALQIDRWQVFGGSWGSTLALAYSQSHPEHVTELVLRGIFMLRKKEIQWFYQKGASELFPDLWQHYLEPIPKGERGDLVGAYYKRLTSHDPEVRLQAAKAWSIWEASTSFLMPNDKITASFGQLVFIGKRRPRRRLRIDVRHIHETSDAARYRSGRFARQVAFVRHSGLTEVNLLIDHARYKVLAVRVKHLHVVIRRDLAIDLLDAFPFYENVGIAYLAFIDQTSVSNE